MKGVRAAVAVALVVLGLGAVPDAHASNPPRVMVVGDSISSGWGGDWSWRNWLWREFERQEAPIDMVGPSKAPAWGARYERAWSWDSAHASASGSDIDWHLPRIAQEVSDYRPDVLVVELGINDLTKGDDAPTVALQLQELIRRAWQVSPKMQVLVAEIPNVGIRDRDRAGDKVDLLMTAWAIGRRVTMVHNRDGDGSGRLLWDPARFTSDNVHPNATGQTLLALRMAQAFHEIGLLPMPAEDVFHERSWSPDARPDVTVGKGRVRIGWLRATTDIRAERVRVLVDDRVVTGWINVGRKDKGSITLRLAPGPHRIQLQPQRIRMTGVPGGYVPVTVR